MLTTDNGATPNKANTQRRRAIVAARRTGMTHQPADTDPIGMLVRPSNRVRMEIPARAEMLFMARMTAVAVASRTNFGYGRVEDLRLALDELCLTLMELHPDPVSVELEFTWSDDDIHVVAGIKGREGGDGPHVPARTLRPATTLNGFSRRILDAIVDEHGVSNRGALSRSWLRMTTTGAAK